MRNIVVVNRKTHWPLDLEGVETVTPKEYLTDPSYADCPSMRVFNLCRSYRYQSTGYYVSLLAEARGHRAIPDVTTMQDFRSQALIRAVAEDLDELMQESLCGIQTDRFALNIYFGKTVSRSFRKLGRKLYSLFQAPMLCVTFVRADKWLVRQISPLPFDRVPEEHRESMLGFAQTYFSRKQFRRRKARQYPYDMAILHNPKEKSPPSDPDALKRFIRAANRAGFSAELITREDYSRLSEFDALFIRETTSVNHHTYRFARRAHAEGLVVIDDPWSILRCANKVYLAEMLSGSRIPSPKTVILQKGHGVRKIVERWALNFPAVLKQPDSAFSLGVKKVANPEELQECLRELFRNSDLVIAQEYVRTPFDWRIGILGRKPLYACKYYMAAGHWQIYNWANTAQNASGGFETLPIEDVPPKVVDTALRAANAVGDGFYGVDVKQINDRVIVIEVNDNPSIDSDVEDLILGDELYDRVMHHFRTRIEQERASGIADADRKADLRAHNGKVGRLA